MTTETTKHTPRLTGEEILQVEQGTYDEFFVTQKLVATFAEYDDIVKRRIADAATVKGAAERDRLRCQLSVVESDNALLREDIEGILKLSTKAVLERDRLLAVNAELLTAMRELAKLTGWRLPVEAIAKAEEG